MTRARRDVGETLIEVLFTIVIVSLTFTSLFTSLATSGNAGNVQRISVQGDVVMRNYAEATKSAAQLCDVGVVNYIVNYQPPTTDFKIATQPAGNVCPLGGATSKLTLTVTGPLLFKGTMDIKVRAATQSIVSSPVGTDCTTTPQIVNGVLTRISVSAPNGYYGENRIEFLNTLDITSMTVTIKLVETAGMFNYQQYVTFEGGNYSETGIASGGVFLSRGAYPPTSSAVPGFVVYTTTVDPGKKIVAYTPPDVKRIVAQWGSNGTVHPTTGDTWCVTTTTSQGTKTDGGFFPAGS